MNKEHIDSLIRPINFSRMVEYANLLLTEAGYQTRTEGWFDSYVKYEWARRTYFCAKISEVSKGDL